MSTFRSRRNPETAAERFVVDLSPLSETKGTLMRKGDQTIGWKVRLNATLAARINLALWDPILKKPRYGARRELIEGLLQEWLLSQAGNIKSPEMSLEEALAYQTAEEIL
jgi:hypothetical protein